MNICSHIVSPSTDWLEYGVENNEILSLLTYIQSFGRNNEPVRINVPVKVLEILIFIESGIKRAQNRGFC